MKITFSIGGVLPVFIVLFQLHQQFMQMWTVTSSHQIRRFILHMYIVPFAVIFCFNLINISRNYGRLRFIPSGRLYNHIRYDRCLTYYRDFSSTIGDQLLSLLNPVTFVKSSHSSQLVHQRMKQFLYFCDLQISNKIPSNLLYKTHLTVKYNCWSLGCIWSIACRRCSNYIFILHLIFGFNILRH